MSTVKLVHLESGGNEVSIRSFQGVELRSPVTVFYDTLHFIFLLYRQGKKNFSGSQLVGHREQDKKTMLNAINKMTSCTSQEVIWKYKYIFL